MEGDTNTPTSTLSTPSTTTMMPTVDAHVNVGDTAAVGVLPKTEPLDEIARMLFEPDLAPSGNAMTEGYRAMYDTLHSPRTQTAEDTVLSVDGIAHLPTAGMTSNVRHSLPLCDVALVDSDDDDDDDNDEGDGCNDRGVTDPHGMGVVAALDVKYGAGLLFSDDAMAAPNAPIAGMSPNSPSSTQGSLLSSSSPAATTVTHGNRGRPGNGRRVTPPKTRYRDAPVPIDGLAYNPVRFQYDADLFEHGVRPPSGEYREFSGHADESATTQPHHFRVYVIDDTERKKGATKRCLLQRDRVRDIVWSLPERRDANGRTVHGVPPTPQDQYDVRVDPSVASLPMSDVPVHNRTRVFLTVRNPPPADPLIAFTVGPVPDPLKMDPFDFVRAELAALGTADAAAVVTTRGESLDMLGAKNDLVNLNQEVSLAAPARHMLGVRSGLVARGLLVRDKMFRERALRIGPMAPALLKREAAGLVDRCRAAGLGDNQIVLSAEMPLRTYVILRLCDLGSELYSEAYLADSRFRDMFKDRGPAHLSAPQTVQLSDAFYWAHLAPQDQRRPEFEEVIRFYQQRGVEVRLKKPHVKSGSSVGRTSESGALRHFKPHSKATHSVLRSPYEIVAPSGEVQALRTVKPRAKTLSPSERNPAAARLDRIAAEAARRPRAFDAAGALNAPGSRLGHTGIARFLKPAAAVKTEPTAQPPTPHQPLAALGSESVRLPNDDDSKCGDGEAFDREAGQRVCGAASYPKPVYVASDLLDKGLYSTAISGPSPAMSSAAVATSADRTLTSAVACPVVADSTPLPSACHAVASHETQPSRQSTAASEALATEPSDKGDILSLHRKAIAFPDPIVAGAPPEGMTETVLTWASVRDKIPDNGSEPLPPQQAKPPRAKSTRKPRAEKAPTEKPPRAKRDKAPKKQTKKASGTTERGSGRTGRTGKRQRDVQANGGPSQLQPMPPPIDAAALLRLLPRQGEPLFLPIVRLLPPDGTSTMPGFGAPYVRLPCPVSTPHHGPPRVLLQQLPLVLPTVDPRHTLPVAPAAHASLLTTQHHQPQPPLLSLQPPRPLQQHQQQHQAREEQTDPVAEPSHNDADWLNLLSAMDADA